MSVVRNCDRYNGYSEQTGIPLRYGAIEVETFGDKTSRGELQI